MKTINDNLVKINNRLDQIEARSRVTNSADEAKTLKKVILKPVDNIEELQVCEQNSSNDDYFQQLVSSLW